MAEFDKRGFAAVDAFFGGDKAGDDDDTRDAQAHPSSSTTNAHGGGTKRLGLGATGATTSTKPSSLEASGLNKRILQVGTKKRHQQHRGDDDEDLVGSDRENDDDDEEEDVGRTAIVQSSSASQQKLVSASVLVKETTERELSKKKKRKKGKKERALDKANRTQHEAKGDSKEEGETEEPAQQEGNGGAVGEEPKQQGRKRKCRKVRSRQKNIYKDKRETKPEHLVPGSKNYQGRPLTAETRSKLNLSPAKSSQQQAWKSNWHDDDNGDDGFMQQDAGMMDALPLAVDAVDGTGDADFDDEYPEPAVAPKKSSYSSGRSKRHSKKSKYKNLR